MICNFAVLGMYLKFWFVLTVSAIKEELFESTNVKTLGLGLVVFLVVFNLTVFRVWEENPDEDPVKPVDDEIIDDEIVVEKELGIFKKPVLGFTIRLRLLWKRGRAGVVALACVNEG